MNAAIRSIVRTAMHHNVRVTGIKRGFDGLLQGDIVELESEDVSDIIHRGGTILKTARCAEMHSPEGQEKAANICKILNLDALMIIGGNGSIAGGLSLSKHGVNAICLPGTIDLDLDCSEYTIGFDTAVNTGMDAINKLKDTSSSHQRCSIIEVMGRYKGYIALWCGIVGGAEEVVLPEEDVTTDQNQVIEQILSNRSQGKKHNMIVVAEGIGDSAALAKKIEDATGIATRATILGHLQRGGNPTALDRMWASVMGHEAVDIYLKGFKNRVIVVKDGVCAHLDIEEGLNYKRPYDEKNYKMMKILAL
ncbi:MAG: 6-phosphofructokinase [Defluviitaleaceae bacterium]|nr:6-phosphofructokinase [Defluviitaleaceae bacterium]